MQEQKEFSCIMCYSWLLWKMDEPFLQPPKLSVLCLPHNIPVAKTNHTLRI